MDDVFEQVGIGAGGHRGEEVAALNAQPARQLRRHRYRRHHLGLIEQGAAQGGVGSQHLLQQQTPAAPHIHQVGDAAEVVGGEQGVDLGAGVVAHGPVEDGSPARVLRVPLKQRHPVAVAEGAFAAAHAVEQIGPAEVVLIAHQSAHHPHRVGMVAAQQLRQRRERELARRRFLEDPQAGQAPQQPEQPIGRGATGLCQLLHRPLPGGQMVGHTQLGGHVDHLGHPGAARQLHQPVGGGEGRGAALGVPCL